MEGADRFMFYALLITFAIFVVAFALMLVR